MFYMPVSYIVRYILLKEYFGTMPWYAVPYRDRERAESLQKQFRVPGIPCVVIIDSTSGKVVTLQGREAIGNDPTGLNFPWNSSERDITTEAGLQSGSLILNVIFLI